MMSSLSCCFQRIGLVRLVVLVFLTFLAGACERQAVVPSAQQLPTASTTTAVNSVAEYIADAEIQAETDGQRAELRKALSDMLMLTAADLQTRRYADYNGTKGARSLVELLNAHLVPAKPQAIIPAQFFADIKAPTAQAAIQKKLHELEHGDSGSHR